jgi:predicted RecB family nuclease
MSNVAGHSAPLSKSRFVSGCQCHKLLWLQTYEKDAPELAIDAALQERFNQGNEVGRLARERFPGGVLVDLEHDDPERFARTRELLQTGAPAIFEATFVADRTYAAIDVLLRDDGGFTLIEVKSGTSAKPKYVLDAAIQTHVAQRAGIDVRRVEIMHLNRDYVHPGPGDLFVREDVTDQARALLPGIPDQIESQLQVLEGPEPEVAIGPHCRDNDGCPFVGRCWPDEADSVLCIHGLSYRKRFELFHGRTRSIRDLPAGFRLNAVQSRQQRSCATGRLVVDDSLREELEPYTGTLGFLDFESVGRALPVWDGTKPWEQIGVQFSYHEGRLGGPYSHVEFLAEPDTDPREEIARRLVDVTRQADHVVMYTAFEKTQIGKMQRFVPVLAGDLAKLTAKMLDLKKIIEHTLYHPEFAGSFSIKDVLPSLVGIRYEDTVEITDGSEASAELARLLFYSGTLTVTERHALKERLLKYCELDTMAMVRLLERLSTIYGQR